MKKKIIWITETAAMLALLICLQWAGSMIPEPITKQLVTGSCVNCVLAVTVLVVGWRSGITVALISPIFAYILNIAPNFITILPIMLGNSIFVTQLSIIMADRARPFWRQAYALLTAAFAKFGLMNFLITDVICGFAAEYLLGKKLGDIVLLGEPMLTKLPAMFAWPQLVTALIGGTLALLITPTLYKALHK